MKIGKLIGLGTFLAPGWLYAGSAILTIATPSGTVPPRTIVVSTVSVNVGATNLGVADFIVRYDSQVVELANVRALSPEFQNSVYFSTAAPAQGKARIIVLNAVSTQTPSGLAPMVALDFLAVGPDPSSTTIHGDIQTMTDTYAFYYASTTAVDGQLRISNDRLPPRTSLTVGAPALGQNPIFIGPFTPLSFTAADDRRTAGDNLGVGVLHTYYALDSANFSVSPSSITISTEGPHILRWYSQDQAFNTEVVQSTAVSVDSRPPETKLTYSPPAYIDGSGNIYVSTVTAVAVGSIDAGSGVAFTQYRLESSTLPFQTIPATFTTTVPAGLQAIETDFTPCFDGKKMIAGGGRDANHQVVCC